VFGDSLIWVPFAQNDSCLSIKKRIDAIAQTEERSKNGAIGIKDSTGGRRGGYYGGGDFTHGAGVGGGTETGLWFAIDDLTKRKVKVDRFILCSDLCCYTLGDDNCGHDMTKYFGKDGDKATVQSMLEKYRREVNPDAYVYSVNLAGYGQSQVKPSSKRSYLLSGWSEQIFGIMRDLEGNVDTTTQEQVEIPTIAVLRARYAR